MDDDAGDGAASGGTKRKVTAASSSAAAKGKAAGKGKAASKASALATAKESSLLKQKSPAEFFAENKNIAGFDNPGKSLYTTMRELVENALDSAESISELPDIEIIIEEITKSKFNTMIGLVDRQRIDEELYDDFESAKAREKRLAKEARFQETQAKNAALGKKVKEAPAARGKGRGEAAFFRVTCKDNGRGMPHDDIPNMLGRVLSGTKYGLRQTRGKFGLGAKMKRENKDRWHGAELQVIIEGNWTTHRVRIIFSFFLFSEIESWNCTVEKITSYLLQSKILHYMRQMAVITPYAQFLFRFLSDSPDKNLTIQFARRTDVMPPIPLQTKHHPSAVDLLLIKRLISETTKQNLLQFLQHEFVNISKSHAEREMGPDFSAKTTVKSLTSQQLVRIHQLFRQAKFDDPSGNVFEGHPFIVEAGISIGGKDVKHGLNIFRYANRIPLLFEQGADVITRTALKRINWSSYKINQQQDKIGVFVSIVSTKIPFKGTGKEYIGDDITEIASAVQSALKQCCLQLKSKIVKKLQARERQDRKRNLNRYIPDVARAIMETLGEIADESPPKRPRYDKEDEELLEKVNSEEVTEMTFRDCLTQHVEQVDYEMALEYAMQSGVSEEPREALYLNSLEGSYKFIDFQSPVFVFRFIP
uniref:DNA topoisomerase VI subunit B transducer domain-containing protein n=1 Tax=Oryza rufipogon TaxID=4529 RepID=A0A0E0QP11_ORYRU